MVVDVGSQALLECLGHAYPTPTLEWIIIHDVRFPKEGQVLPTGTLQFDPVVPEDAGTYRCRISNSIGADFIDIMLEVRGMKYDRYSAQFKLVDCSWPKQNY